MQVRELVHTYPGSARPALDRLSLEVPAVCVFGVLGPNGGGKTTLFRVLATLLAAQSGRVCILGHELPAAAHSARRAMGIVFQNPSLDLRLTVRENLMHQGHLYGLSGRELATRIDESLHRLGLADRAGQYARQLSGGLRRRVEIAKALLHRPRLLLLDEPSTGLDPAARRDLWALLAELRGSAAISILLTTHFMDEADRCDQLAIVHEGRLMAVGTPTHLKAAVGGDVIQIEPAQGVDAQTLRAQVNERFGPWMDGGAPALVDGRIRFEHADGPRLVPALAAAFAWHLRSISVGKPTLDDVFAHLTGRGLAREGE